MNHYQCQVLVCTWCQKKASHLHGECATPGCKITCFPDMALNYMFPAKPERLKTKLYCGKVCVFFCFFFPFLLVPPQRCLPVICIPKCSEKQQQETWVTWYPWQGFCSSTSAGQHYLLWALYIWEGASRGLKLLDSAPDLLCGSLKVVVALPQHA